MVYMSVGLLCRERTIHCLHVLETAVSVLGNKKITLCISLLFIVWLW
jgi:hypothetical protein